MKKLSAIGAVVMLIAGMAQAGTATWNVATVHGQNEFTISSDGSSLHYNPQGWTDYKWNENNGSPAGTIAQGMYGDRTGMKTFATTDVAFGQKLSALKLEFEYNSTRGGYPSINFFLKNSDGKVGIFAPTSLGISVVGVTTTVGTDGIWKKMTLDLTRANISNTDNMGMYEHNGLSDDYTYPYTTFQWGDIKDLTIAGWYDYQRSPEGGWNAWGTSFDNQHGLALIWGDTVNSKNSYGSAAREIRNVTVSFGGTDYSGTFANAQVPEPATMSLLVLGSLGLLRRKVRG